MMVGKLLVLGAIIGSNNFAASLALGALGQKKYRWRAIAVFGIFEFLMPLLGMLLGRKVSTSVGEIAQYVAPALLAGLGFFALYEAYFKDKTSQKTADKLSTWQGLILLELGLSMDNLIAGFSLGLNNEKSSVWLLSGIISVFAMVYTYIGFTMGDKGKRQWETSAKVFTGALLLGLAAASFLGWLQPE
jgi:putative Mn2+ efflux pump MntP